MKTTHILIGLMATGSIMIAGSVTIPNTFVAGHTAKASEVNANFSAVKSAVDGNANDIATNVHDIGTNKTAAQTNANDIATNKNDIQTNQTNIQGAISKVTVGNGLEGGGNSGDINITLPDGYIAVHGSAFVVMNDVGDNCEMLRDATGAYFSTASTYAQCKAYASVPLPPKAQIKKLVCRVKHNEASADVHIKLISQYESRSLFAPPPNPFDIHHGTLIDLVGDTTSPSYQVLHKNYTPGMVLLNEYRNHSSYLLEWAPPATSTTGNKEILYDCAVYYAY